MLNTEQIDNLLDGCGFLESCGNLYEYCGRANGKYYFQDVNSQTEGSWLFLTYQQLLTDPHYDIQY